MKSPKAAWLRERQEIVTCLATGVDPGFEQPSKRKEETERRSQLGATKCATSSVARGDFQLGLGRVVSPARLSPGFCAIPKCRSAYGKGRISGNIVADRPSQQEVSGPGRLRGSTQGPPKRRGGATPGAVERGEAVVACAALAPCGHWASSACKRRMRP